VAARTQLLVAAGAGLAVSLTTILALRTPWQAGVLLGWDGLTVVYLVWIWWTIWPKDATETARTAHTIDGSRGVADLLLIGASVASLVGVGLALLAASSREGVARSLITATAVVSGALSWGVVHTVFTVRYADLYYRGDGGIAFKGDSEPDYRDFAYLAFTVGMTYQVSDTDLTSRQIRRTAFRHALLSFVFGTAVIAMSINVVASLFNR
jgi:uncharacterized membrane protein